MAYWYQKYEPRPPEPLTIWAPEGGVYLLNINHPKILELYQAERRRLGVGYNDPFSDAQRWVWEVDLISKMRDLRRVPEYVIHRLLLPPYRGICEVAGVNIDALCERIKKRPPKRSAVL